MKAAVLSDIHANLNALEGGLAPDGTELDLAGVRSLLNPGSVGQPRAAGPAARARAMRSAVAMIGVVLLVGCGGAHGPKLPPDLAQQWRADATCARAGELRASVIAAINAHRVPQALQEPLTSEVNALASGSCTAQRARDVAGWLEKNS